MSQLATVQVLTPQESHMVDLEEQLQGLAKEVKDLPARIQQQTSPPAPKPAREERLRQWAD